MKDTSRKLPTDQLAKNKERFYQLRYPIVLEAFERFDKRSALFVKCNPISNPALGYVPGSAYFFGPVGSGKTVQLLYYVLDWVMQRSCMAYTRNDFMLFTQSNLLSWVKGCFTPGNVMNERDLMVNLSTIPLLVIDELGTKMTTDWEFNTIMTIIDNRYKAMLPTAYTSNYSLDELGERLGDNKIPSRIEHDCGGDHIFEIKGYKRK